MSRGTDTLRAAFAELGSDERAQDDRRGRDFRRNESLERYLALRERDARSLGGLSRTGRMRVGFYEGERSAAERLLRRLEKEDGTLQRLKSARRELDEGAEREAVQQGIDALEAEQGDRQPLIATLKERLAPAET